MYQLLLQSSKKALVATARRLVVLRCTVNVFHQVKYALTNAIVVIALIVMSNQTLWRKPRKSPRISIDMPSPLSMEPIENIVIVGKPSVRRSIVSAIIRDSAVLSSVNVKIVSMGHILRKSMTKSCRNFNFEYLLMIYLC